MTAPKKGGQLGGLGRLGLYRRDAGVWIKGLWRNNQSWARLDRFLVTQQWLDMFNGVAQCRLHRPTSDHFPILLMGGGMRRGPTLFRFENMWLKADDFKGLLRREVFGRLEVNKILPSSNWSIGIESPLEAEVKGAVAQEGDRNTGYFHRMTNAHRRNNSLDRIMINGEWLTEDQEVREGIVNAFQILLSEEPGGDKAPGPDGFTVAFWQECWDFVKEEVVDLFKEFYEHGSFAKCLNTTFLVLIPKKGGAEELGDFRPISLLGGLFKLLAKVLANRLKKVLDRVVSVDQNAFLDIEKVYDSINWKFLMKVLRKMAFGSRWMEWMWWCISTAKFSILINGVPAGFFRTQRCCGKETLSLRISLSWVWKCLAPFLDGLVKGAFFQKRATNQSSWILAWFEAASRLRINLAKSVLIPVREVDELEELAAELGCRLGALPTVYLGLPLGAHHKTSSS
ncbi:Transposon TX1 uncharacterized 149 kDa protein [Vitis vinifera]|uniref:Transposon TX1 uncharacterized 149 kDa protein n=1 Tax=Vitis vinifera TaxID=29760 RepID=A0A438DFA3_VITVI|nr:Transposon TX1 uncharacterized 149 kDa protein [Vitis vinifera]